MNIAFVILLGGTIYYVAKKLYIANMQSKGGVVPMMGWGGYGYAGMMNGTWGLGFGIFLWLLWLVAFIDLVLLGIWLWKKLQK